MTPLKNLHFFIAHTKKKHKKKIKKNCHKNHSKINPFSLKKSDFGLVANRTIVSNPSGVPPGVPLLTNNAVKIRTMHTHKHLHPITKTNWSSTARMKKSVMNYRHGITDANHAATRTCIIEAHKEIDYA